MIRPYFGLSYRRAFETLLKRGLAERAADEWIVCCDFSNPAIDAVGGRYYFSLVKDLIDAGFFPVFTAHRATLSSFGTSRMKSQLLGERLGVISSLNEINEPYFLITDREESWPAHAKKIVSMNYDYRLCESENEIAFPVFVHPQIATLGQLPFGYQIEDQRSTRIFFGGNTEPGKYDQEIIRDRYGMMTRRQILAAAPQMCYRPDDALAWLESDRFHSYVLCETQLCKIPPDRWLHAMAKADFFLACPGVGMPLCHNLVEALAAGTIPILQYADYLTPRLRDQINCLTFHDTLSLKTTIQTALTMSQEQIQSLRRNVHNYYEANLAPGRFSKQLFGGQDGKRVLLLNDYRVPRGKRTPFE